MIVTWPGDQTFDGAKSAYGKVVGLNLKRDARGFDIGSPESDEAAA